MPALTGAAVLGAAGVALAYIVGPKNETPADVAIAEQRQEARLALRTVEHSTGETTLLTASVSGAV